MADDRESNLTNLFSTRLSSAVGPTDLTFPVESMVGAPASPCFIFIRSNDGSQFEIIDADGAFAGSAFAATAIGKRYLTGSSAASGMTHAQGSIVEVRPVAQYWQQVHDRIDAVGASGAGAVARSLYDANTILKADADDTPVALPMGASTILARLASGGIKAATPAEVKTLLEPELSGAFLPLAGGTLTGDLILAGDPDSAFEAATKQYVDRRTSDAATVATSESTTSTSYTNLTTSGPVASFVCPPSGEALIIISALVRQATGGQSAIMSVDIQRVGDGGPILSAAEARAAQMHAIGSAMTEGSSAASLIPVTGLTPGSTYTVTAKYRVTGGTGTFTNRCVAAIPQP